LEAFSRIFKVEEEKWDNPGDDGMSTEYPIFDGISTAIREENEAAIYTVGPRPRLIMYLEKIQQELVLTGNVMSAVLPMLSSSSIKVE
jgi:hypothetical protein